MKAAITLDEFEDWRQFYLRWPFDDLHRYHRPAALVSCSFTGGEFDKAIAILQPPVRSPDDTFSDVDRQVFGALLNLG